MKRAASSTKKPRHEVPQKWRDALALKEQQGLTREDLAERYGVSVYTIDKWLGGARLEQRGQEEGEGS